VISRRWTGCSTATDLNSELEKYVSDLRFKVVPYRGGFQL